MSDRSGEAPDVVDPLDDPAHRAELGIRLARAAKRPEFEEWIDSILARTLATPRSPDAVDVLRERLDEYIGDTDTALLLMTAITFEDDLSEFADLFFQGIDEQDASGLIEMLRRARSLYRADLQLARDAWAEGPKDWRSVFLDIAYSFSRGAPTVDVTIELHDGEKIRIESTSSGVTTLVSYLTEQLIELPVEVVPEQWDIARLVMAALGVIDRYGVEVESLPLDAESVSRIGETVTDLLDRAVEPDLGEAVPT